MPGMDGFRPHASEEALRGRVARAAALRAHGARQPIPSHEPGPPRPPAVAAAAGMHQGTRAPGRRGNRFLRHPVGQLRVGTEPGGMRDDPAVVAVDRRREARPSRPRP